MTQEQSIIKYFNLNTSTVKLSIKEKSEVNIIDIETFGKESPKQTSYIFSF
mgnify:FL=1